MVTWVPSRGSLIPRCSFWATTSRMRSASLLARALSATGPSPVLSSVSFSGLVVVAVEAPSDGQQLHLGAGRDQPFAPVEHVGQVRGVAGDHGKADAGPAVKVQVVHLGRAHGELPLEFGDDRAD